MPTSPVDFVLCGGCWEWTGAVTNLMLCGYSSIALKTSSSNLTFFFFTFNGYCVYDVCLWQTLLPLRSPVVSGGATGLHLCVFSLEGRDRTGLSHSWNLGCGAGSELAMTAAVHLMSIQARKKKRKKKKVRDTGHEKHRRLHPLLCKCWKNKPHNIDVLPPQNEMQMHIFQCVIPIRIKQVAII